MIAYSVHLFAQNLILAAKDFQRWWLTYKPNVALNIDEWQKEFEKYLRQGMTAPKQLQPASVGKVYLMAFNHPLYKRAIEQMAWETINTKLRYF